MRAIATALLVAAVGLALVGTSTAAKKKPVSAKVTLELTGERAGGVVKAQGKGVPARVRRGAGSAAR